MPAFPACPLVAALEEGGDDALLLAVCRMLKEDQRPLRAACKRYKAPHAVGAEGRGEAGLNAQKSAKDVGLVNARYA